MEDFQKQMDEEVAFYKSLLEQGKIFGTATSITLDKVREKGYSPIGICWYAGEETLIFKTKKEARACYIEMEKKGKEICCWFYGEKDFLKEIENITVEVDWL